jgi:hypothetical protein
MINKLTGKKMEDTYLDSKDKKGYIFDIKRPSVLSNTETYEGNDASFKGLETRTGLGNRVLRRVNFIKPEIKPRKVIEGKFTVSKNKTLEDMIKSGLKIKYEEPDPWDLEWLEERKNIIDRLTKVNKMDKKEIDDYLQKYPPLNRTQRTRPVNRNPFEDANKPIKEQLEKLGTTVQQVSKDVQDNTVTANVIAVQQMNDKDALDTWMRLQYAQLGGILRQSNIDSTDGQNMLGAKLQEIVKQLGFQSSLTHQLLMNSLKDLNINVNFNMLNIDNLNDTGIQLALLKVLNNYYPGQQFESIIFYYINKDGVKNDVTVNDMFNIMMENRNIYIINDDTNKILYFSYLENEGEINEVPYTDTSNIDLSILKYKPEEEEIPIELEPEPEGKYDQEPEGNDQEPEGNDQGEIHEQSEYNDNIQRIINTIQTALEQIAEENYTDEYNKTNNIGVVQKFKRILRINVDYNDKNFLNIDFYSTVNRDEMTLLKEKNLYDYTYKLNEKYVYFVWYSKFGSHQFSNKPGTQWQDLVNYINTDVINKRKLQADRYARDAQMSSKDADMYSKIADMYSDKAKDSYINSKIDLEKMIIHLKESMKNNEEENKIQENAEEVASKIDQTLEELVQRISNSVINDAINDAISELMQEADNMVGDNGEIDPEKVTEIAPEILDKMSDVLGDEVDESDDDDDDDYDDDEFYDDDESEGKEGNEEEPSPNTDEVLNKKIQLFANGPLINSTKYPYNPIYIFKYYTKGVVKDNTSIVIFELTDGKYINIHSTIKKYWYNSPFNTNQGIPQFNQKYGSIASTPLKIGQSAYITNSTGETFLIVPINQWASGYAGDFMNGVNNQVVDIDKTQNTEGSGIRAFHKKNRLSMYKSIMTKGKGLKLAGHGSVLAGKGRKVNPWIEHVKKYRASHPNVKYSDVLKQAKATYKK